MIKNAESAAAGQAAAAQNYDSYFQEKPLENTPSSQSYQAPDDVDGDDPLYDLVNRVAADPGVLVETSVVSAVFDLRESDAPQFERLRRSLKDSGARMSAFEQALERHSKLNAERDDASLQGRSVTFPAVRAWTGPLNEAELLSDVSDFISSYVALPEGAADAMALWAAHTWAFDEFAVTPRLALTSPEKRCGKTTALRAVSLLAARPLDTANVSAAAIFRIIEDERPTLLIDEADTFMNGREELRGVLNAGYGYGGQVIRCVGEDHEPRAFSAFAPVAIAAIGHLPDTLLDRSLIIPLRRKFAYEEKARFKAHMDPAKHLRSRLARMAMSSRVAWRDANPETPDYLNDRASDNWRVLLAIADHAGGEWPARARASCAVLHQQLIKDGDTIRVTLLRDIRVTFNEPTSGPRISSVALCGSLAADEAGPWAAWGRKEEPITPPALARLLKPFNIRPKVMRSGGLFRGYERDDFMDAWARYLSQDSPADP